MFDKFLELTQQEIWQFMPMEGYEHLPDITTRNMWDLCDMAVRFGDLHVDMLERPTIFFSFKDLRVEVYNFIGNGSGGSAGMMIGKHRPNLRNQGTVEGAYMLVLLNGMLVIWDKGHCVRTVQRYIHEIDSLAYARGLVVAGRRIVT